MVVIDLSVIVKIINKFPDRKHVDATLSNLKFFEDSYITDCLKRGLSSGRLSFNDIETAKRWLDPSRPEKPRVRPKTLHYY